MDENTYVTNRWEPNKSRKLKGVVIPAGKTKKIEVPPIWVIYRRRHFPIVFKFFKWSDNVPIPSGVIKIREPFSEMTITAHYKISYGDSLIMWAKIIGNTSVTTGKRLNDFFAKNAFWAFVMSIVAGIILHHYGILVTGQRRSK
jgi:hypothetical protein